MSYASDMNYKVHSVDKDIVFKIMEHSKVKDALSSKKYAYTVHIEDSIDAGLNTFVIEDATGDYYLQLNNVSSSKQYNLYDIVAGLKSFDLSNSDIATILNDSEVKPRAGEIGTADREWTAENIKTFNSTTTKAASSIQSYLDAKYKGLGAYVSVLLNEDGDSYKTRIVYRDPDTNELIYTTVKDLDFNKSYSTPDLDKLIKDDLNLDEKLSYANAVTIKNANDIVNAESQKELANNAQAYLDSNPNLGTDAKTDYNLSRDQLDSITAKRPGTENLDAINQANGVKVNETISGNMKGPDSEAQLIQRKSLAELQKLAGEVDAENIGTTQRNITAQQAQLLEQIRNDPELYRAITSQLRTDTAAGTIAGQRAANVAAQTQAADQTYDASAAELYKSLFTGDSAVADKTRSNTYGGRTDAVQSYAQDQLQNMSKAGQDYLTQSNDLRTALDSYDDAVAEEQAKAQGKATVLSGDLADKLKKDLAANDAELKTFVDTFNIGTETLQAAANGDADVSAALKTIYNSFQGIKSAISSESGYKKVELPEYWSSEKLENVEYEDAIASEVFQSYLDKMDELTKYKTLDELKKQFGFVLDADTLKNYEGLENLESLDLIDEEGLATLFKANAEAANKQSDRVFNDAQRAYIAAITAGDAKTAEQLTRLAVSTGGAKGNLYKTSALAGNYIQQRTNAPIGIQLATDFQNQQAANKAQIAQSAIDANKTLTGWIGSGTDAAGQATLYGTAAGFDKGTSQNIASFGDYGNKKMTAAQKLNSIGVNSNIANYDRLAQLISQINSNNAAGATNNLTNAGTKYSFGTEVDALKTQAEETLKKLK